MRLVIARCWLTSPLFLARQVLTAGSQSPPPRSPFPPTANCDRNLCRTRYDAAMLEDSPWFAPRRDNFSWPWLPMTNATGGLGFWEYWRVSQISDN